MRPRIPYVVGEEQSVVLQDNIKMSSSFTLAKVAFVKCGWSSEPPWRLVRVIEAKY